jgi:hypothetical protein
MKKIITILFLMLSISLSAQNDGFNYKALLADGGKALSETKVSIRFSIIQQSSTVYTETIQTTTDKNGVLSVVIGSNSTGTEFEDIRWSKETLLKVEINTGDGFTDFGTNPFHNVPTAMYAKKAGNVFTGDYGDLTNSPSIFYKNASTDNAVTIDDNMYHTGSVTIGKNLSKSDDIRSNLYVYKKDSEVSQSTSANTYIEFDFSGKRGIGQLIYMTGNSISAPNNPSVDGQEIIVSTSGDARMKCLNTKIDNDGNGSHYSIYNLQHGDGNGQHVGIYNSLQEGKGLNYGIINSVSSGMTSGAIYGIYNKVEGTASNSKYGTFNLIESNIAGTHYAVYGDAQKAGSYAGYFKGDVSISRKIKIEGGTPGLGKVLTSDENGWASWQTSPNTNYWKLNGTSVRYLGSVGVGGQEDESKLYIYSKPDSVSRFCTNTHIKFDYSGKSGTGLYVEVLGNSSYPSTYNGISGQEINIRNNGDSKMTALTTHNRTEGSGSHVGVSNSLSGSGNGLQIGIRNRLTSSGSGDKYGTYNSINKTSGGKHYAVYGDAQKVGSYAGYFLGDVSISRNLGIGLSTPLAPLHIKSGNTASIILESSVSNIRPGIQFINNTSHYISGDDKSNETFGFYSTWSSNRNYNAKLRVYGKARGSWGKYIEFTHDGTDATINTDAGNLTIAPAGKEVIIDGKITTPSTGNNDLKAYAYGTINANGSTVSGTGNFHIDTGAGTGIYKIIFNGGVYDDKHFTTVVTMHNTYWPSFIFCYATSNTLVVKIFNSDGRTRTNGKFSFVTYKN